MSMTLTVTVPRDARAGLAELMTMVEGPSARTALHGAMGEGVRETTRDYLQRISAQRHATADRLGATPSGHLEQAARAVEAATLEADATGGTLTINHPGLVRALRDVTIRPTAAKALAIPLAAIAYNRRPSQFGRGELFVWQSKTTGNAFLAQRTPNKGDFPNLLYLLVRSVTQKQDRTLLPSDQELGHAAAEAAEGWFQQQIQEAQLT